MPETWEIVRNKRYGGTLVTVVRPVGVASERHLVTIALIPGSFDPFHNGHLEVVERAGRLFDEVVVATLRNPQKAEPLFSLEEREEMLQESLAHLANVRIVSVATLVVNVAHDVGATAIVKGLRAVSDFENELQMAQMNRQLSGIETLFIPTSSTTSFIASRLLREVARYGGDVSAFVPKVVALRLAGEVRPVTDDIFDDDPFDETRASGRAPTPRACVRQAVDVVSTARTMPLSASVLVDREELLELLQAALDRIPDELRQARWLLRERDEFLATRQREADNLLEDVRAQAERMVQRTEIVRQANHVAQRILDDAREEARRLRHEAEDYCDQKLASFEIVLDRTMKTVQAGREKLQAIPPPLPEDKAAPGAAADGDPTAATSSASSTRTTT